MELLPWINPDKLNPLYLSRNINASPFLKKNKNKIDYNNLSYNYSAIELLKLSPDKINWFGLSENPAAMELLKANEDKINWTALSSNINSKAIEILKANPNKIDWNIISVNPALWDLLIENPDKINYELISMNFLFQYYFPTNIYNFDWIIKNKSYLAEKIKLSKIMEFTATEKDISDLEFWKQKPENIDWKLLSSNPLIFTYTYSFITLISSGILEFLNHQQNHSSNHQQNHSSNHQQNHSSESWPTFLCSGVYDPRLLIQICDFANQIFIRHL